MCVNLKKAVFVGMLLYSSAVSAMLIEQVRRIPEPVRGLSTIVCEIASTTEKLEERIRSGSVVPQISRDPLDAPQLVNELLLLKDEYLASIASTFQMVENCSSMIGVLTDKANEIKQLLDEWLKPSSTHDDFVKLRFSLEVWNKLFFGKYQDEEGQLYETPLFTSIMNRFKIEQMRAAAELEKMQVDHFERQKKVDDMLREKRIEDAKAEAAIAKEKKDQLSHEIGAQIAEGTRSLAIKDAAIKMEESIMNARRGIEKAKNEIDGLSYKREIEEAELAIDLAQKRIGLFKAKAEIDQIKVGIEKTRTEIAKTAEETKKLHYETVEQEEKAEKARAEAKIKKAEAELKEKETAYQEMLNATKVVVDTFKYAWSAFL